MQRKKIAIPISKLIGGSKLEDTPTLEEKKEKEELVKVKFNDIDGYLIPDVKKDEKDTAINYEKGNNILVIGTTASGKSTFVSNILNRLEDCGKVFIFNGTADFDHSYYETILTKKKLKYKNCKFDELQDVITYAEEMAEKRKHTKKGKKEDLPVIVFDDVADHLKKNQLFDNLITYSRKIFHTLICCVQSHVMIDPQVFRNMRVISISTNLPTGELESCLKKITSEFDPKMITSLIESIKAPHIFLTINLSNGTLWEQLDKKLN